MATEHRRRLDTNGDTMHERVTDTDFWARTASAAERYKILWIVVFAVLGYFGTFILEPLRAVPVMAQDIADLKQERIEVQRVIKILTRIQCFNISIQDRIKYDVDCGIIPAPNGL